jgi:hypothetical protein
LDAATDRSIGGSGQDQRDEVDVRPAASLVRLADEARCSAPCKILQ